MRGVAMVEHKEHEHRIRHAVAEFSIAIAALLVIAPPAQANLQPAGPQVGVAQSVRREKADSDDEDLDFELDPALRLVLEIHDIDPPLSSGARDAWETVLTDPESFSEYRELLRSIVNEVASHAGVSPSSLDAATRQALKVAVIHTVPPEQAKALVLDGGDASSTWAALLNVARTQGEPGDAGSTLGDENEIVDRDVYAELASSQTQVAELLEQLLAESRNDDSTQTFAQLQFPVLAGTLLGIVIDSTGKGLVNWTTKAVRNAWRAARKAKADGLTSEGEAAVVSAALDECLRESTELARAEAWARVELLLEAGSRRATLVATAELREYLAKLGIKNSADTVDELLAIAVSHEDHPALVSAICKAAAEGAAGKLATEGGTGEPQLVAAAISPSLGRLLEKLI